MIRVGSTWTTNRTRCTEQSDEYLVLRHLARRSYTGRHWFIRSCTWIPCQAWATYLSPPESLCFSTDQRVWISLPSTSRLCPYCEPRRHTSAGRKGGDSGFEHRRPNCGTTRVADHQCLETASPYGGRSSHCQA
jgi:hypothetical protein